MLTGLIRIPIFTRYFTPEEYGIYGIVYITYFIISIFLFNWLTNCIWRFYNEYKQNNSLNQLYSNLLILHLFFSIVFLFVTIYWQYAETDVITKKIALLLFGQLTISNLNNYFFVIFRLESKSGAYNIFTSLRSALSLLLQLLLVFKFNYRIEAVPLSSFIVELIILPCIIFLFLKQGNVSLTKYSKPIILTFFKYSVPSIFSSLGLYLLTSGDRYIIAIFNDMDKVGIYNQVYNLCQMSMMAIINFFFAIINPSFMKELSLNFKASSKITLNYLSIFILFVTPALFYLSIFGNIIANVMLGKEFRSGNDMIPWLMLSVFIYGLTLFPENRLKFSSNYKTIIKGFIACSVINIILNLVGIPFLTYKFAAISTFISYFLLMIYFYYIDIKENLLNLKDITVAKSVIVILSLEFIIHLVFKNKLQSLIANIIEGCLLLLIYIVFLRLFHKDTFFLFIKNYNIT
jgi:O-antigen/teichoic acid export membrane protein